MTARLTNYEKKWRGRYREFLRNPSYDSFKVLQSDDQPCHLIKISGCKVEDCKACPLDWPEGDDIFLRTICDYLSSDQVPAYMNGYDSSTFWGLNQGMIVLRIQQFKERWRTT